MLISFLSEKQKLLFKYCFLYFLRGFFFLKQYLVLLLDNTLSSVEVSLVLSISIVLNVLLSIPLSTLSFKFGNKNIFFISTFLFFLSYVLLIFDANLYTYIMYSIFLACFDVTFASSNEGLVYENMKNYGMSKNFAEYRSKAKFCKFFGMTIAAFLAGDLVYTEPRLIFIVDAVILLFAMLTISSINDVVTVKVTKIKLKKPLKYIWKHKTLMKCILHGVVWHSFYLFMNVYKSLYFEELAINDLNVNLMMSLQMSIVTLLQVFMVKKLSKKNIFFHYGLFVFASILMVLSFYNYRGFTSYILFILYYVLVESTGELTYSNMMSFLPKSEIAIILSISNLGNNLGKLIFVNSFGIISSLSSHRTAFLSLSIIQLVFCTILYLLISIDTHMKNVNRRNYIESR